eukprot:6214066-Pleurochrysis_carterae.AAC.2
MECIGPWRGEAADGRAGFVRGWSAQLVRNSTWAIGSRTAAPPTLRLRVLLRGSTRRDRRA